MEPGDLGHQISSRLSLPERAIVRTAVAPQRQSQGQGSESSVLPAVGVVISYLVCEDLTSEAVRMPKPQAQG